VSIRIDARFNGPDGSGNGGYAAGLFGQLAGASTGGSAAMVTLRRPPPLDTPLAAVGDDAGIVEIRSGSLLVAEAARTSVEVDPVRAVPYERAAAAAAHYPGLRNHPFPRCFVCGPGRAAGDGLRLFPGRLGDGRTACIWMPDASLVRAAESAVAPEFVWAALDCPGAWAADLEGRPLVLGRITAQIRALPALGESCVVMGLLLGSEGRKTWTATTVFGEDGQELGRAHATWIAVQL